MKESKKSPFVVFENVKITKKQQERIENLLISSSNERGEKETLVSEETPSFMIIRSVFLDSKDAEKIFLQKTARGQLNIVLEGIKQKHFGKNAFESHACLLKKFSTFYYDYQDQLFTKIEENGFSGVFAESCNSFPSILIAGVVNGHDKNIHLYYGYMAGNLALSNDESLLGELCVEVWEIKDNTFIKYDFDIQKMTFHKMESISKKEEKKKMKRKKVRKELKSMKKQLAALTNEMNVLQKEQMQLKRRFMDDGK